MRTSWLVCALLGTLAWGQAAPPPAAAPGAGDPGAALSPDTIVLTVTTDCPPKPAPKPAATKAGTATAAAPKAAPAKPAGCKTTYTKAQFEKLAAGLSPNVTPQFRKQLASALPRYIAMSDEAKKKGLDKTSRYETTLQFAKMQILASELQRDIQTEASKISSEEIEKYYKSNPEAFEQFNLERLFVPRSKQEPVEAKEAEAKEEDPKEEKLTEEQQKAKEAEEKAKNDAAEQAMAQLAQKLRERAVAGEEFVKLQKEAFEAGGMKIESPTVSLAKVRRTGLPPAHVSVFELKAGDVSQVINDNGGHYIYKVVSRETQPLDQQVKDEIRNTLQTQRTRELMEKVNNSFKAEPNEAYFGPPGPAGMPPGRMPNPRMPQSPMAAPHPAPAAPAQAPAEKPN